MILEYPISRVYLLLTILYTEMFTAYGWYETKRERGREKEWCVCGMSEIDRAPERERKV